MAQQDHWELPHIISLYLKNSHAKKKKKKKETSAHELAESSGESFGWKESQWILVFWLCLFIKGKHDSSFSEVWLGNA